MERVRSDQRVSKKRPRQEEYLAEYMGAGEVKRLVRQHLGDSHLKQDYVMLNNRSQRNEEAMMPRMKLDFQSSNQQFLHIGYHQMKDDLRMEGESSCLTQAYQYDSSFA